MNRGQPPAFTGRRWHAELWAFFKASLFIGGTIARRAREGQVCSNEEVFSELRKKIQENDKERK
jgi:hypothetical protein